MTTCGTVAPQAGFCSMELVVRQKLGPVVCVVMWLVMCCQPWKPEKVISLLISEKAVIFCLQRTLAYATYMSWCFLASYVPV
jgi:hypothetical protein